MTELDDQAGSAFTSGVVLRFVFGSLTVIFLSGCESQSGDAIVLAKEHIAAAPQIAETANPESMVSPDEQPRQIGDDEIAVDEYVMKPEVRGTSRDPRALKDEQWLVKVRISDNGRTFNVPAERAQFDKLKEGDRIRVSYRVGKYTKTVWGAQIQN